MSYDLIIFKTPTFLGKLGQVDRLDIARDQSRAEITRDGAVFCVRHIDTGETWDVPASNVRGARRMTEARPATKARG